MTEGSYVTPLSAVVIARWEMPCAAASCLKLASHASKPPGAWPHCAACASAGNAHARPMTNAERAMIPNIGLPLNRDSPDEPRTGVNFHAIPAFWQDRRVAQTTALTSRQFEW